MEADEPIIDESELRLVRKAKLDALRADGNAFPNDFRRSDKAEALQSLYAGVSKEMLADKAQVANVAGRVLLKRVMGKASFLTIQDGSGRIQLYVTLKALGEQAYEAFKSFDIGDIVGAHGTVMKTNKGELSIAVEELRLLTKSLRPLPEKHKGLTDTETR